MRNFFRFLPLFCLCFLACSAGATQLTIGDPPPVSVNPITDGDIPFPVTFGSCAGLPATYSGDRGCFAFFNETSSPWTSITLTLTKGTPSGDVFDCSSSTFSTFSCNYDPTSGTGVLSFTNGLIPNNTLQAFVIAENDLDPDSIAFSANVTFATAATTPEPSAWVLLGTGLFGAGTMMWTRRRALA